MPSSAGSFAAASNTRRLASSTATSNAWESRLWACSMLSETVSTASREARSPALAPPMPSASTYNPISGSIREKSSLFALTQPLSLKENNEDFSRIDPEMGLYVLADGMGGAKAGERASRLAVDTVSESILHAQ